LGRKRLEELGSPVSRVGEKCRPGNFDIFSC
jgi:hypothetical protein